MRVKAYPTLKVFVASPGDVDPERRAAVRAIAWVSEHVAKPRGWRIEPLMWERDVLPGAGRDAQSVINAQIGEMREVALFLLVMRDRFGTPTARAGSGTEEEYDRAVAARKGRRAPKRPELALYFGRPLPGAEPKQRAKVEAFKAKAGRTAMWSGFASTADFRRGFQEFLTKWVSAELDRLAKPALASAPARAAALTARNALLLGDRVYRCVRQTENGEGTALTLALGSSSEERALTTLRDRMAAVPFAYGLNGGTVRVSGVEFERDGRGTRATVKVTPERQGWGSYGHLDEAVRERAVRLVLLGEAPRPKAHPYDLVGREEAVAPVVPPILARGDDAAVRAEARLRAVQALLGEGIVTEIERLDLAAPTSAGIKITFAGYHAPSWGGTPSRIKLSGFVKTKKGPPNRSKGRPAAS